CTSHAPATLRHLPSFPTRRSSDLLGPVLVHHHRGELIVGNELGDGAEIAEAGRLRLIAQWIGLQACVDLLFLQQPLARRRAADRDRKSTRLNSSHVKISYAVFCLK